MLIREQIPSPSIEDVRQTFINFPSNEVISYIDYKPAAWESLCHVYSYPSLTPYYHDITNNFPGGLFQYVREISLCDNRSPFEYEFFAQIQKSFPHVLSK